MYSASPSPLPGLDSALTLIGSVQPRHNSLNGCPDRFVHRRVQGRSVMLVHVQHGVDRRRKTAGHSSEAYASAGSKPPAATAASWVATSRRQPRVGLSIMAVSVDAFSPTSASGGSGTSLQRVAQLAFT